MESLIGRDEDISVVLVDKTEGVDKLFKRLLGTKVFSFVKLYIEKEVRERNREVRTRRKKEKKEREERK